MSRSTRMTFAPGYGGKERHGGLVPCPSNPPQPSSCGEHSTPTKTIGEKAQRGVAVHDAYVTEWHRIVRPSRTASLSETRSLFLAGVFPPLDPASPVLSRRMAKASDLESLA